MQIISGSKTRVFLLSKRCPKMEQQMTLYRIQLEDPGQLFRWYCILHPPLSTNSSLDTEYKIMLYRTVIRLITTYVSPGQKLRTIKKNIREILTMYRNLGTNIEFKHTMEVYVRTMNIYKD